jgi:hypothetical protein
MINVFLSKIMLENKPWVKTPEGFWSILRCSGFTVSEGLIVQYFLLVSAKTNSGTVTVTAGEASRFAAVNKDIYYNTLQKMKNKGLIKISPHCYDLVPFMESMEVRAKYWNQGVKHGISKDAR